MMPWNFNSCSVELSEVLAALCVYESCMFVLGKYETRPELPQNEVRLE